MQLLGVIVPKIGDLQKEGEAEDWTKVQLKNKKIG